MNKQLGELFFTGFHAVGYSLGINPSMAYISSDFLVLPTDPVCLISLLVQDSMIHHKFKHCRSKTTAYYTIFHRNDF